MLSFLSPALSQLYSFRVALFLTPPSFEKQHKFKHLLQAGAEKLLASPGPSLAALQSRGLTGFLTRHVGLSWRL